MSSKRSFFNLFLVLFLNSIMLPLFSQVRFEKSYPFMNETIGYGITQTFDDGYVICGTFRAGEILKGLVIRTDAVGDTLWTRLYENALYAFCPVPEGGFLFTGWHNSSHEQNLLMMKTDKYGNIEWENSVGTSSSRGRSICRTADSGYCIVGGTTPYAMAAERMLVVRINKNGNLMWTKLFGDGVLSMNGQSIIPDNNAGFVICGTKSSEMETGSDMVLLNIDSAGNAIWMKTYYKSLHSDQGYGVVNTLSGGYFAAGIARLPDNANQALYLVRTNDQGDTIWTKTFDTLAWASPGVHAIPCNSGGFAITGVVYDPVSSNNNVLLKRFDAEGNILWGQIFGSLGHEYAFNLNTTSDQGFIVSGSVWDPVFQTTDAYLAKTDDQGHVTPVSTDHKELPRNICIFPDPTPGLFTLTSVDPVIEITVISFKGVTVREITSQPTAIHTVTTDLSSLPNGIYMVKIRTTEGFFLRKVIKDRPVHQ